MATKGSMVNYDAQRLETLAALENNHFWFVPRRRRLINLIKAYLPLDHCLLDLGCGTGGLCLDLRNRGYSAIGVDPHVKSLGLDPTFYQEGTTENIPFTDASFDAVSAFDVLEHVDDQLALRECRRVLRPGGLLFVSVPAYKWLWSERDIVAGHQRRYNRPALRALLTNTGFELCELSGYQFFLLPFVFLSRFGSQRRTGCVSREDDVSPLSNRILSGINQCEVSLATWIRPPIGSSLLAVARRLPSGSTL